MHKFSPERAEKLERPDRYEQLQPEETLRRFGLRRGVTVADIGAGTGFFSRAAASIVGTSGRVLAVDMSAEMLASLRAQGIPPNMLPVLSAEYRIPLADHTADFVLLAFVMHENEDPLRFLREVGRIARPNATLLVIDWKKQQEEHGPAMDERMGQEEVVSLLKDFVILEQGSLNASHFFVVARTSAP
jgi:ubiquinone/menaquinone biosynthesis C-methylase UbiE